MVRHYMKLVRDNIIDIIKKDKNNKGVIYWQLVDEDAIESQLTKKLQEEIEEFRASRNIEELADLEEVIRAILKFKGISYNQFEEIRSKKYQEKGGFNKYFYLATVEDDSEPAKEGE